MLARYTAALHATPVRYAAVGYDSDLTNQLAVNRWLQGMLLRGQPGVPGGRTLAQIHHYNIPDMQQRNRIDPRIAAQLHAMLGQVFQGNAEAFPVYHDLARDNDVFPTVGRVPTGSLLGNLNTELQRRMGLHKKHPLIQAYGNEEGAGARQGHRAQFQSMNPPPGTPGTGQLMHHDFESALANTFGIPHVMRGHALDGELHPLNQVLRKMTEQATTSPLTSQLAGHLGANMDAREAWARERGA